MTAPSPAISDVSADADKRCAACHHSLAAHDGIGARFCAATIASGSTRGCVCVSGTSTGEADVTD